MVRATSGIESKALPLTPILNSICPVTSAATFTIHSRVYLIVFTLQFPDAFFQQSHGLCECLNFIRLARCNGCQL